MKEPLFVCGITEHGKPVLGGAFTLADTHGLPLWCVMDEAEKRGCVISFPHYFACAMEHGWDDRKTFRKIREALADRGDRGALEHVRRGCMAMFMAVAETMPGQPATEVGRRMREQVETK